MPFRSFDTLQSWLEEFQQLGYGFAEDMKVIPQDGALGANTGLVSISVKHPETVISIQPSTESPTHWEITIERHEGPVTLSAADTLHYATELSVLSALCAFLEAKSLAYRGTDHA